MIFNNKLFWACCFSLYTLVATTFVHAESQRIISLSPHVTELLYAIEAEQQLVATVEYSDYPAAAKSLPIVGNVFQLDWERMLSMRPDLVIGWQDGTPGNLLERVKALGLRLVLVKADKLDSVATQLRQLGVLTGKSDKAERLAENYLQQLAMLEKKYKGRHVVNVFYQISRKPLFTINGRQIISDAIQLCGGRNIFSEFGVLAPQVSIESVLQRSPKIIFYAGSKADAEEAFTDWKRWPKLEAVKNGHLRRIDANLMNRPTPRMLLGIQRLCEAVDAAR